jgi:hypothetical protein
MSVSFQADGGREIVIISLCKTASDPGPLYFKDGDIKVTNASKEVYSYEILRFIGPFASLMYVFAFPYPSIVRQPGGRMYFGGSNGIGTVHQANNLSP